MYKYKETWPEKLNLSEIETPAFVVDCQALQHNVSIFDRIQDETGCKFILALKSFSCPYFFPLISEKFHGVAAGSLWEAELGAEKFGREIHSYSPAYRDEKEIDEYLKVSSHLTFNSFSQWNCFKKMLFGQERKTLFGIRVNPEHREVEWPIYDPSAPKSRFGVKIHEFENQDLTGISGFHFHNLCELGPEAFERTLHVFEEKFGKYLKDLSWVNFGGGQNITDSDYNIEELIKIVNNFKTKYPHLEIYFEPGTSVFLDTGILVASVLDIVHNETAIGILDVSAAAHMPEVMDLKEEYDPDILHAKRPGEFPNVYRLASNSCMTGDIIGDYSFPEKLKVGDKIIFLNMSHYTMVRMNTFCGVQLPSIYSRELDGKLKLLRKFDYGDFKSRLE
jgi:carboxynorspermidine decarboxylase